MTMKFAIHLAAGALCLCQTAQTGAAMQDRTQRSPAAAQTEVAETDNDYHLSAGDKLRVSVFGEDTLTGEYIITSSGNLTFPLIGNLKASGKTVEALQEAVRSALSDGYINDPRVTIQVISFRPYYILGEVARPGEYPVSTGLTLEQAVASAGGYTYRANTKRAYLKRATSAEQELVDIRGPREVIIRAGDTIRIRERHF